MIQRLRSFAATVMLGATLASAGCTGARTQILVFVRDDDFDPADDAQLELLDVHATSGSWLFDHTFRRNAADPSGRIVRVPGVLMVLYPQDNGASSAVTIDIMPRNATNTNMLAQPVHYAVRFRPGHTDILVVDLSSRCRTVTSCMADQTCYRGNCETASPVLTDFTGSFPVGSDASSNVLCDAGTTICNGTCVDVTSDPMHCGSCGNACPAGMRCETGMCRCSTGVGCDGGCVDPVNDPNNCGACGNVCPAMSSCVGSACLCRSPTMFCLGACVDVTSDANNCGGCGRACLNGTCAGGVCHCTMGAVCSGTQYCCTPAMCCAR